MKKNFFSRIFATALGFAVLPFAAKAQDIHFSQFYETSILRNPSLTGVFNTDYKLGAIYRNQWSSISAPFQTALVTAETRIAINQTKNDFVSFGLLAYYDKAGSINMQTLTAYPSIAFHKSLEDRHESYLSVGFTGGYIQRSFDPSKMTFDEQYQNGAYSPENNNGEANLPNPKISQFDLGTGINFSSNAGENNEFIYSIGVSAYHLTQPKNAFFLDQAGIKQNLRLNVNAGLGWRVDETWKVQFQANYARQDTYSEIIGGGFLGWNLMNDRGDEAELSIFGGVFYRYKDAFIPSLKITYRDLGVAASYDVNASKLSTATNLRGGFEISVFKTGWFSDPMAHQSRTVCPRSW